MTCLCASFDGSFLWSADKDGRIQRWAMPTHAMRGLPTPAGHSSCIEPVWAMAADQDLLMVAGEASLWFAKYDRRGLDPSAAVPLQPCIRGDDAPIRALCVADGHIWTGGRGAIATAWALPAG